MATSSVIGSGLDIPSLVSTLVSAARAPAQNRINTAGTAANAKLSAVGQIKSAMTSLQSALGKVVDSANTPAFKATVPTDAGFSANAGSKAVAGNYGVEVVRLASAQKLASGAFEKDDTIGSGKLTIAYGTDSSISVTVKATDTLEDIAKAVNKASGGKGAVASVITSNEGQHLVFNAVDMGSAGALTITADNGSLAGLTTGGGLQQKVAATDALVRVDGFERTSSSNTIEDIVPGVSLTLTKAAEGTTRNLAVAGDSTTLKTNITALVTAYNGAMSAMKSASAYNATTKTASALTGDSLVRNLQSQLRSQVSGNTTDLKELGISLDKDGVMSFNATTFDATLAKDPEAVTRMLSTEGKFSAGVGKILTSALDTFDGTLVQRTENLNKQVSALEGQLDALGVRMDRLTTLYTAQFSAMEKMIVQLQGSTSSLSSLLG